jgi:hypothetical protein
MKSCMPIVKSTSAAGNQALLRKFTKTKDQKQQYGDEIS